MTREAESFFRFARCSPTDANRQVSAGSSRLLRNARTGKFTSANRQIYVGEPEEICRFHKNTFQIGRFRTPTEAMASCIPNAARPSRLLLVLDSVASHPHARARRGSSPAHGPEGTRASCPSWWRLIPSPHPEADALATQEKGLRGKGEDAERPALNPETCSPPWLALPFWHPRRRSIRGATQNGAGVRWLGRGRARAAVGSLGAGGGVVTASGPLDAKRDRIAARRSRGACAARHLRVFGPPKSAVSFHIPAATGTVFGMAARCALSPPRATPPEGRNST